MRSIEDTEMTYSRSYESPRQENRRESRIIDLTGVAERASHAHPQLRRSRSPISLTHTPRYDIDMTDSDDSSRSRKLIVLEDRPSAQPLRSTSSRVFEIPAERQFSSSAEARHYDRQVLKPPLVSTPIQRQVVYEPIDGHGHRHMTEPMRTHGEQRFYVLEEQQRPHSALRNPHERPVYENYQNSPLRYQNIR